jgi:stage II sporulation protein E
MSGIKTALHQVKINIALKKALDLAITFILVALLGRVFLFDTAAPFGAAFIAACFLNGEINIYAVTAGALLGASTIHSEYAIFYVSLNALTAVLMYAATRLLKKQKKWMAFACVGTSYVLMTALIKEKVLYTLMISGLELVFIFVIIYVFEAVLNVFMNRHRKSILTEEEVFGISFIAIVCVLGMGMVNISGVYISTVLAIFFAMLFSYLGGPGLGAGAAIALGAAAAIGGSADPLFIGSLGVCALIAGILKKIKKTGVAVGFILTNAVITFLINGSDTVIIPLIDSVAASVLFMAIPEKTYRAMGKFVDINLLRTHEQELHFRRFRQATVGRLKEVSEVFNKTGEMFTAAVSQKTKGSRDISCVLALVAEKTCEHCVFRDNCWDRDFLNTYGVMEKLYMRYEKEGRIELKDIPAAFQSKCMDVQTLLKNCETVFDAYSVNLTWKRKVEESRYVTGEQLKGVSRIIGALGAEMDVGMTFLDEAEKEVMRKLDEAGVHTKEVCVESRGGAISARVKVRSCGGMRACKNEIEKAVSAGCMRSMRKTNEICLFGNRKFCELAFEEARKFGVLTGVAQSAKRGASGDSHTFTGLKDGRYLVMLCDGMGSGEKARRESEAAASLIENFYMAGFDDDTVFDTINRLMLLKSPDDMFSTVDLCMLNLIEGTADFTKIGAERSYILRGNEVYNVHAGTLPIGILDEVSPVTIHKKLKENDLIVMFTDGVGDLEPPDIPEGEWILKAAGGSGNPQEAADNILKIALQAVNGVQKDDMSVMVTKITA